MKDKLIHAATEYDKKQSKRAGHNPYALGQYFQRIDSVCEDVENGATPESAISAGFMGGLRRALLKSIGIKDSNKENNSWFYIPASKL
jgi:hypothetical protein